MESIQKQLVRNNNLNDEIKHEHSCAYCTHTLERNSFIVMEFVKSHWDIRFCNKECALLWLWERVNYNTKKNLVKVV